MDLSACRLQVVVSGLRERGAAWSHSVGPRKVQEGLRSGRKSMGGREVGTHGTQRHKNHLVAQVCGDTAPPHIDATATTKQLTPSSYNTTNRPHSPSPFNLSWSWETNPKGEKDTNVRIRLVPGLPTLGYTKPVRDGNQTRRPQVSPWRLRVLLSSCPAVHRPLAHVLIGSTPLPPG